MIKIRQGPKIGSYKIYSKDPLFNDDRLIIKITEFEIILSRSGLDDYDKANVVFNGSLGRCVSKSSSILKPGDYLIDKEDSDCDNLYVPLLVDEEKPD